MSDIGRRFRVTWTYEFALTAEDVADQERAGDDAYETARIIAESSRSRPIGLTFVDEDIEEVR